MESRLAALVLVPLVIASLSLLPVATAQTAKITVDAGHVTGAVSPFVFGHNIEAADQFGIFSQQHNYVQSKTGDGLWNPDTRQPVPEVLAEMRAIGTKMLRYPGGCLAHNFNWKEAIGKPEDRPNFAFGVDEFISYCRAIGAEPLMNFSDYVGGPQEAAELVEYLNAPATAKYPWAQKRAQWGHVQPYGVRYFEMGNESDHGNHQVVPFKKFTAEEYASWYNQCAQKMRAIDPTIKIGALMGTGTGPDDPWNFKVLSGVKDSADFIIVHTYAVGVWAPEGAANTSGDLLMRACMAAGDQFDVMLGRYRTHIRQYTGKNIPLAITEYNASFVQGKPVPYRFAYGPALFSADYIRVLLQPGSNVEMANYWHFINGYWGLLRGPRTPGDQPRAWKRQPAYYLFRLWGQHFGTQLVNAVVESPRVEFEGYNRTRPAQGERYAPEGVVSEKNLLDGTKLSTSTGDGYRIEAAGEGVLRATLQNLGGEKYPAIANVTAPRGTSYLLSFEARTLGDWKNAHLGIGMNDARGWDKTRSAIGVEGIERAKEWTKFEGKFATLPDAEGAAVVWRLRSGAEPITGNVEVRNLKVQAWRAESFPAYAALTSTASLSPDGKKLFVIVFNKHHADDIETKLDLRGFAAKRARRWTVSGPSLEAVNTEQEQVREIESGVETPAAPAQLLSHRFTARSMTAWEFER